MALPFYKPSCPLRIRKLNKFLTVFLFSSCFSFTAIGQVPQRLSYTSYTVAEGLVSNLIYDIALDANNFLWVSTATGVQRFDGKTFYTIQQRNDSRGIHYDKKVNFMPLQNGELLIATPIAFMRSATMRQEIARAERSMLTQRTVMDCGGHRLP